MRRRKARAQTCAREQARAAAAQRQLAAGTARARRFSPPNARRKATRGRGTREDSANQKRQALTKIQRKKPHAKTYNNTRENGGRRRQKEGNRRAQNGGSTSSPHPRLLHQTGKKECRNGTRRSHEGRWIVRVCMCGGNGGAVYRSGGVKHVHLIGPREYFYTPCPRQLSSGANKELQKRSPKSSLPAPSGTAEQMRPNVRVPGAWHAISEYSTLLTSTAPPPPPHSRFLPRRSRCAVPYTFDAQSATFFRTAPPRGAGSAASPVHATFRYENLAPNSGTALERCVTDASFFCGPF